MSVRWVTILRILFASLRDRDTFLNIRIHLDAPDLYCLKSQSFLFRIVHGALQLYLACLMQGSLELMYLDGWEPITVVWPHQTIWNGKTFFSFLLSSQIRAGRAISPDYMTSQLLVELLEPPLAVHHHPSSLSQICTELWKLLTPTKISIRHTGFKLSSS